MTSKLAPEDIFQLLNCHVNISHGTFQKFLLYHDLLISWQSKINLIGSATIDEIWRRHFLDSLQLINAIPGASGPILDIGSGAGFPGLVLAIAGNRDIHLVEKDAKKIAFLREVARVTDTKISIHHDRIENLPDLRADIITARAYAPLGTLFDNISRQVSHGTICLFPKGKNWSMEIGDAKKNWSFDYDIIPSVTDKEGAILRLTHITKRAL